MKNVTLYSEEDIVSQIKNGNKTEGGKKYWNKKHYLVEGD
jgi:hypothetical protein